MSVDSWIAAYDRWDGLVPLLGGIYLTLLGLGILPRKPKDPEHLKRWRKKFGTMSKILGPLLTLSGACEVLRHV